MLVFLGCWSRVSMSWEQEERMIWRLVMWVVMRVCKVLGLILWGWRYLGREDWLGEWVAEKWRIPVFLVFKIGVHGQLIRG